jgi:hypothetical protein
MCRHRLAGSQTLQNRFALLSSHKGRTLQDLELPQRSRSLEFGKQTPKERPWRSRSCGKTEDSSGWS